MAEELKQVYFSFAGIIDQNAVANFARVLALASQDRIQLAHLFLHSSGGMIGDGIAVYQLLSAAPFDIHVYGGGGVQSIAVLPFLAAKKRIASPHTIFLLHKSSSTSSQSFNARMHQAVIGALHRDDARVEQILKSRTSFPPEWWEKHIHEELVFGAEEAVQYGVADEIGTFVVPRGTLCYNIGA